VHLLALLSVPEVGTIFLRRCGWMCSPPCESPQMLDFLKFKEWDHSHRGTATWNGVFHIKLAAASTLPTSCIHFEFHLFNNVTLTF
jgi:hypothetical protein